MNDKIDQLEKNTPDTLGPLITSGAECFTYNDLSGDPPGQPFIVEQFLPANIVGSVIATGGTGKTFFLIQLAMSIASGIKFFDWNVPERGNVLFLAAEEQRDDFHRRVHAIRQNWGLGDWSESMELIQFISVSGVSFKLDVEETTNLQNIEDHVRSTQPKLVIIDPARRFMSGDENDSESASKFITALEAIKNANPVKATTVLFSHHTSKFGAENQDQHSARGSTALTDNPRWQVNMAKINPGNYTTEDEQPIPESDQDLITEVKITKTNYSGSRRTPLHLLTEKDGVLGRCSYSLSQREPQKPVNKGKEPRKSYTPRRRQ